MSDRAKKQVGYKALKKKLKAKDRAIEVTYLYAPYFIISVLRFAQSKLTK